MKTNRSVVVGIEPKNGDYFELSELKISFTVEAQIRLNPNKAEVRIYNLNQKHRNDVSFKYDINRVEYGGKLVVYAGYVGDEKMIFEGDIVRSFTTKEGADYITYVEGLHRAESFAKANINKSFPKGTSAISILKYILNQIGVTSPKDKDVSLLERVIGSDKLESGEIFTGDTSKILKDFSDKYKDKLIIDFDENGPIFLEPGKSNGQPAVKISKETGLIGVPTVTDIGANIEFLLDPSIKNGTELSVESPTLAGITGYENISDIPKSRSYIVEKIVHVGDNRGGLFITQAQGLYPGGVFGG
jgi:hypothetical protein